MAKEVIKLCLLIYALMYVSFWLSPFEVSPILSVHAAVTFIIGLLYFGKLSFFLGILLGWSAGAIHLNFFDVSDPSPRLVSGFTIGLLLMLPHYLAGGVVSQLSKVNANRFFYQMTNLSVALLVDLLFVVLSVHAALKLSESLTVSPLDFRDIQIQTLALHVSTILIVVPCIYLWAFPISLKVRRQNIVEFFRSKAGRKLLKINLGLLLLCIIIQQAKLFNSIVSDVILFLIASAAMVSSAIVVAPRATITLCLLWHIIGFYYVFNSPSSHTVISTVDTFLLLQVCFSLVSWLALTLSFRVLRFKRFAKANATLKERTIERVNKKNEMIKTQFEHLLKSNGQMQKQIYSLEEMAYWDAPSMLPNRNKVKAVIDDMIMRQEQCHVLFISLEYYRDYYIRFNYEFVEMCIREIGISLLRTLSNRIDNDGEEWLYRWSKDKLIAVLKNYEANEAARFAEDIIRVCNVGIHVNDINVKIKPLITADISSQKTSTKDIIENLYNALPKLRESSQDFVWCHENLIKQGESEVELLKRVNTYISNNEISPFAAKYTTPGGGPRDTASCKRQCIY